jgi:hypothetical protein
MGRLRGRALISFAPLSLGLAGCSVDLPDLGEKRCPCASGWTCDVATDRCMTAPPGQSGAVVVSALKAVWTTPESVRWEWEAIGVEDELLRYELVTARVEEDLGPTPGGSARVWTPVDNPELGEFRLPHTGIGDQVVATTTDGHAPGDEVFARLIAIDTQQRRSVSNVAGAKTNVVAVFDEPFFADGVEEGGWLTPEMATVTTAECFAGSACIAYQNACGAAACFQQVGATATLDLADMEEGDFLTTAYLEFAASHDSVGPSFWSHVRVQVGEESLYAFEAATIRAGGYRVYQVPLRVLRGYNDADPLDRPLLTWAEIASGGIHQLTVGGWWDDGATVLVDEARLRW